MKSIKCRNCSKFYSAISTFWEMCNECMKEHEDEYNRWLNGKPFKRNPLKQVERISFKFINNLISLWRKLC